MVGEGGMVGEVRGGERGRDGGRRKDEERE